MKQNIPIIALSLAACGFANARGLYQIPNSVEESIPVQWTVGAAAVWDSNTSPGGITDGDETFSINPYVGVSFLNVSPQTTLEFYGRLGVIYYFDEPAGLDSESTYGQATIGLNLTHRFDERLRFVSNNYLNYGLEPEYSYGFATSRQTSEFLFYTTDNALGYRWTERFATYTGFQVSGLIYDDLNNADRNTWVVYNQFRYQVTPSTVATASYRYSQSSADDAASDSSSQYFLAGVEHRLSPSTVVTLNAGAQLREVDGPGGDDNTNPYIEASLSSQVNQQFALRGYARYGAEDYDTVFANVFNPIIGAQAIEYDNRLTLRIGLEGTYQVSEKLALFGGFDVINASYEGGSTITGPLFSVSDADETLFNITVGASLQITNNLYGNISYNYTDSDADAPVFGRTYDRSRISVGVSAQF